jgi:hypothetical protein
VRLKDWGVISPRKIGNRPFKEGARRLSQNKPISYRSFFHAGRTRVVSDAAFLTIQYLTN